MDRRGFLGAIIAAAAAPAFVRASSLMKVGSIFVPDNRLLTIQEITNTALDILYGYSSFLGQTVMSVSEFERLYPSVSRDFASLKSGDTIIIRKPAPFRVLTKADV